FSDYVTLQLQARISVCINNMKKEIESAINLDGAAVATRWLDNDSTELIAFFNSLGEVFFTVDLLNSRVMQISTACESLFGYSQSDFMADPSFWIRIIHPADHYISEEEDKVLKSGGRVNNEYRISGKDETVKWGENKIVPTLDDAGVLIRIDGVTRDITPRKEAEARQRQGEDRFRKLVETA